MCGVSVFAFDGDSTFWLTYSHGLCHHISILKIVDLRVIEGRDGCLCLNLVACYTLLLEMWPADQQLVSGPKMHAASDRSCGEVVFLLVPSFCVSLCLNDLLACQNTAEARDPAHIKALLTEREKFMGQGVPEDQLPRELQMPYIRWAPGMPQSSKNSSSLETQCSWWTNDWHPNTEPCWNWGRILQPPKWDTYSPRISGWEVRRWMASFIEHH